MFALYLFTKDFQSLPDSINNNSLLIFVEAIGALFLLDTYFDQSKKTDQLINTTQTHNKQTNYYEQEESQLKEKDTAPSLQCPNNTNMATPIKTSEEIILENTAIPEYLEVVKSEYAIERSKKQSFENRSGLLLTLLSAVCIFYFQSVKPSEIINLISLPLTFSLMIKIISGFCIYISFILTLVAIIKTIGTKNHDNFETDGIQNQLLDESRMRALKRIIFTYQEIIHQHRITNEKRGFCDLQKPLFVSAFSRISRRAHPSGRRLLMRFRR